jgi:hypothetical protein
MVIGEYPVPPPSTENPRAYPVVFYPDARSAGAAMAVELAHGEERRAVDVTVRPVSAVRITGRVIGPREVIAGLVVRLLPAGSESLGVGFEQATALVGSDGTFTMVGVPAGRYILDARTTVTALSAGGGGSNPASIPRTPGSVSNTGGITASAATVRWAPDGTMFGTSYTQREVAYSASRAIDVSDSGLSDTVLELSRGGSISGRVAREDGTSLPGTLSVWVEPADGNPALGGSWTDREVGRRPDAAFSIEGLQRGEYFLRASAGGLLVKAIVADVDRTDRPIASEPGVSVGGVVITLTNRAATLFGQVRDHQGVAAAREAAVVLFPVDRTLWTRFGLSPPRIRSVTYFGSQGYRMTGVPAGEYLVIALDPTSRDGWHAPGFFEAAASLATRVTLTWGTSSELNLRIQRVQPK